MTAARIRPPELVRQYVTDIAPDATVATQWTKQAFTGSSYVWVHELPGTPGQQTPMLLRAQTSMECYADRLDTAADLAFRVHDGLWHAWRSATVYPDGWISAITVINDPVEERLEGQPAAIYRYAAEYRIMLRPTA